MKTMNTLTAIALATAVLAGPALAEDKRPPKAPAAGQHKLKPLPGQAAEAAPGKKPRAAAEAPAVPKPAPQAGRREAPGAATAETKPQDETRRPRQDRTATPTERVEVKNTDVKVDNRNTKVTVEQQTEIRNSIRQTNVERQTVDVNIAIGIAVPSTVRYWPLPPTIVQIVPAYAGYAYFVLADGRIAIIDPNTLQVVYIIA